MIELLPGTLFSGMRVTGSISFTMVAPAPGYEVTQEDGFSLFLEGPTSGFPGEGVVVPYDLNMRATFPRTGVVSQAILGFSLAGPQVSTPFGWAPYADGEVRRHQGLLALPANFSGYQGFLFVMNFVYEPIHAGETILLEFPDNGLYVGPVFTNTPEPGAGVLVLAGLAAAGLWARRERR